MEELREIQSLRTPCYILDEQEFRSNLRLFRDSFQEAWGSPCGFGFSVKTNHLKWLVSMAAEEGYLAEVVSPDEYAYVQSLGIPDGEIIYNGPQKGDTLLTALREGALVNLDSLEECQRAAASGLSGLRAGLRVNFDLEARCPGETTAGREVSRFGLCEENGDLEKGISMLREAGIRVAGLHMHQSSSTRSLGIFRAIAEEAVLVARRYGLDELDYVDMGGGYFGGNFFPGKPTIPQYAQEICSALKKGFDPNRTRLILEPGAGVLATSMDYLTRVLSFRNVRGKRIVTVDGTILHINPFMRPHPTPFTMICPGESMSDSERNDWIVAGSTCMEMDRFWPRDMNRKPTAESMFLFHCCGAYMAAHNSNFINAAPAIYLRQGKQYSILREKNPRAMAEM